MKNSFRMTEVRKGIFFVEGPASNWVILADSESSTLIDAGYPADAALVDASIKHAVGDIPVRDVLVTHGHSDHIGSIPHLVATRGVRVWASPEETPNVKREVIHQIGFMGLLPRLWQGRYLRWAIRAVRAGGLSPLTITDVHHLEPGVPVVFSGHTVTPRLTQGHTPGHLVFELPERDVVVAGDAVVTAHPTIRSRGRQVLPAIWHWNSVGAHESAQPLLSDRRTILPGHGPLGT